MNYSIQIGSKNTWTDWHLIPTSRPLVEPPSVRTIYYDIPGSNGSIDLTEFNHYPTYSDREGSWEFMVANGYKDWNVLYSEILNYLHGREFTVSLESDPGWNYHGRLNVSGWTSDKDWSKITIGYRLDPVKLKVPANTRTRNFTSSYTWRETITGSSQPVKASIIFSGNCNGAQAITNGSTKIISTSPYTHNFVLLPGSNSITVVSTKTATFTATIQYNEGSL